LLPPVVAAIRPIAIWQFPEVDRMNWLFGLVIACCAASNAFAQSAGGPLRVATRIVKPFVFEEKGKLTGFSVELWDEIAKQMNVKSAFMVKPTVKELLDALKSQQAALGIA